jgi:hexosaminidase
MIALLLLALLSAALALRGSLPVFPLPRSIAAHGPRIALAPLAIETGAAPVHAHVRAALARFQARLAPPPAASAGSSAPAISRLALAVARPSEATLDESTDYSYSLTVDSTAGIAIAAATPYGAVYALETLAQLVEQGGAHLQHDSVRIEDSPSFAWRGLMIDAGRRFFPMPAVANLLDTMLAVKLNVLHLHASDECRWGVESKLFPNLTASLGGVLGGFYTQEDIALMVAYAEARGIRIVPEFDIPSHSRGLRPAKEAGIVFCEDVESQSQIYGDPAGSTLGVLTQLFDEMAGLFPDPVFHIGADETSALGPCTTDSTFALERKVLNHLEGSLNKTAAGWEEVLFDAGAATNKTVVYAWSRHTPQEIISAGRRAVDSVSGDFYMTAPAPPYPGGWKNFWYDISTGVDAASLPSLLGGEMSMWTDTC